MNREERQQTEDDHRRQVFIRCHQLFNSDLGRDVLRDLEILFGYADADFEDTDNILSVKPHERRGMKMPIRHIHACLAFKPNKPNQANEHKGKTNIS